MRSITTEKLQKTLDNFTARLATLRTGKAHPQILSGVRVQAYGNTYPLSELALVGVREGALYVQPYNADDVGAINKAIQASGLGLNPIPAKGAIMVPVPRLSGEQSERMIVVAKKMAEEAKVAIRNIRRDAMKTLVDLSRDMKRAKEVEIEKEIDAIESRLNSSLAGKIEQLKEVS